jgi:hypothetical protein
VKQQQQQQQQRARNPTKLTDSELEALAVSIDDVNESSLPTIVKASQSSEKTVAAVFGSVYTNVTRKTGKTGANKKKKAPKLKAENALATVPAK